jgi:hypothetical protein
MKRARKFAQLTDFEEEADAEDGKNDGKNGYDGDGQDMRVAEEEILRVIAHVGAELVQVHDCREEEIGWK